WRASEGIVPGGHGCPGVDPKTYAVDSARIQDVRRGGCGSSIEHALCQSGSGDQTNEPGKPVNPGEEECPAVPAQDKLRIKSCPTSGSSRSSPIHSRSWSFAFFSTSSSPSRR